MKKLTYIGVLACTLAAAGCSDDDSNGLDEVVRTVDARLTFALPQRIVAPSTRMSADVVQAAGNADAFRGLDGIHLGDLGDDAEPRFFFRLGQVFQTFFLEPLERIWGGTGLVGATAQELGAALLGNLSGFEKLCPTELLEDLAVWAHGVDEEVSDGLPRANDEDAVGEVDRADDTSQCGGCDAAWRCHNTGRGR